MINISHKLPLLFLGVRALRESECGLEEVVRY